MAHEAQWAPCSSRVRLKPSQINADETLVLTSGALEGHRQSWDCSGCSFPPESCVGSSGGGRAWSGGSYSLKTLSREEQCVPAGGGTFLAAPLWVGAQLDPRWDRINLSSQPSQ